MTTWSNLIEAFQVLWIQPDRSHTPALVDDSRVYTYGELHAAVGRRSAWLQQRGVCTGDRVAIAMERSPDLAIMIMAVMAAGACPCPLEPDLGPEEVLRRSRITRFKWIVADQWNEDTSEQCGLPRTRWLTAAEEPCLHEYWHQGIAPEFDGFLLFTSGSSGKPKGVLQNHRGLLTNALGIMSHTSLNTRDKLLHVMPLHHTNGVNNQLLAPLLAGSCVALAPRFKAEHMPDLLDLHRPTLLTGVPTMYSRMLPLQFSSESLAMLRMLRCGSAPITEELHRRIEDKFKLPLVISYGLSEATCTSTMNPPGARKIGSIGTPLEGQSVFLRDPEGREVRQPGSTGEICISGPSLMSGYLLDGADGQVQPVGNVLQTGDLGQYDAESYLFITGRLKDVIIRGGENLSPNLIEEVITAVPGVSACCVVGQPHSDLGEVPVAFVVREQNAEGTGLLPATLHMAVESKLSRIHQPKEYFFILTLPENATGKVDRKKLQALART
jgi:acyl-CoA synthetase (AMP-forming)/AMP-acid ligase II